MKILVIPDVHNQVERAQKVLDTVPHDRAIFLGDYFDSFHDTPEDARKTMSYVYSWATNKKITLLVGNHDMPYLFNNRGWQCPGFTPEKFRATSSIFNPKDPVHRFSPDRIWLMSRVKFVERESGVYFSHAGLTRFTIHNLYRATGGINVPEVNKYLWAKAEMGAPCQPLWFSRETENEDGVLWVRWWVLQNQENRLKQIVGHTPHLHPQFCRNMVCLDAPGFYGIVEGREVKVERFSAK